MWQFLHENVWAGPAALWVLSAAISAMQPPSALPGNAFYAWIYGFLHAISGNLDKVAGAIKTPLKAIVIVLFLLSLPIVSRAQVISPPAPSPFATSTMSFNLTQISLPNQQQTLSGVETDAMINFSEYVHVGETTVISTSPFIGGRYEYVIEAVSNYLQNHSALTGANFQFGITGSAGVVKASDKSRWGERAGIFLKYAPAGSENFNLGVDVEWNNLPGVDPSMPRYGHHIASVAIGPNFRF